MHLHARAGLENLGMYLSRWDQDKVSKALASLSRAVERVAVDYSMEQALGDMASGLDPRRDNRSVTDPEWVEKGLASYGCPIHTTTNGSESTFTVSGHGPCSCRRSRVSRAGITRSGRSDDNDHSRHKEAQPTSAQGVIGLRHVSDDVGEHARGTVLSVRGIRRDSQHEIQSRPFLTQSYKGALRAVYDTAGSKDRGLEPLSVAEVVENHILPTSYAGAPLWDFNRNVLDSGARLAHRIIDGKRGFDPYVFGRRVQPATYDHDLLLPGSTGPKTRLVWMAPLPTTIIGTRYSKRVMAKLSKRRPFSWGLQGHERGTILAEIETRFRYTYSLDFSKFDSSVPARMIDDAFRVARTHLDLNEKELNLWRKYTNDFIHSRIIAPDGNVYQKHKGVPSGSAFTSIIDSIVNLILVSYMWEKVTGHSLPHDRVLIMGDDVVVGSNSYITKSQLAQAASDLGFVLSVEKTVIKDRERESQHYTQGVHFCGQWWFRGQPHRPEHELIQRMVFPEKHRKRAKSDWVIRALGYAMTSREGFEIFVRLFRDPNTLNSYLKAGIKAKELGWSEETVPDVDLPGDLRRRLRIEGESVELTPTKTLGGMFGRWT